MSTRRYRLPQLPSTVTTSIPRKGSLTSEVMWTLLVTHLQISTAVSARQHLQWSNFTGCRAIDDSVYHPSTASTTRVSYLSCCTARIPGFYSRRTGGNCRDANASQLLGVRWSDFVTNVTILESTGVSDIRDIIAGRRHSFFAISGDSRQMFQPTWLSNLASTYVTEPNPAPTGPALRAVHETHRSSNL